MSRFAHILALYAKYVVLVVAVGVLIALAIWLWVNLRGWLKGMGDKP